MTSGRVAWSLFGLSALFAAAGLTLWTLTRSLEVWIPACDRSRPDRRDPRLFGR